MSEPSLLTQAEPNLADASRGLLPAAVLWDMDGTLIDSEPYWWQIERQLVSEVGGTWTQDDCDAMVGQAIAWTAQNLIARGVPGSIDEVIDRMVAYVVGRLRSEVPWMEGALPLVRTLQDRGVSQAIVTSSYASQAHAVAAAAPGAPFAAVVSGQDVARAKPDPEPYLLAAAGLGVDPSECVAFEDSVPGIRSALAAGVTTIGIRASGHLDDVLDGPPADHREYLTVVQNLSQVTPELIESVFQGRDGGSTPVAR